MAYQNPKGTVDYYPEECSVRNYLFDKFRELSKKYGFKEVESPAIEDIKLLTKKSGDEVSKQIFTLEKKGDEKLGLRFDITVPLTRMFIERQKSLQKPVKWSYCTRVWRYEKPQQGRLREFYQMGVEFYGSDKPMADAEVINLIIDFFKLVGFTEKDVELRLNNRKLLEGLLLGLVKPDRIMDAVRAIDKNGKIEENEFKEELKKAGVDDAKKIVEMLNIERFDELEELDMNDLATEGLNELKAIYPLIDKQFVKLSLSTARGLDYYTGTVFEVFDKNKKYRSLCGGGRYDSMVEQFGGEKTPATGFSIGMATLSLLMKDMKKLPKYDCGVDYYIAPLKGMEKEGLKLVRQLRKNYSAEIDASGRNLGNQFKYADAIGAKNVIVVGEEEVKTGIVKVKDMRTGKEKSVEIKRL